MAKQEGGEEWCGCVGVVCVGVFADSSVVCVCACMVCVFLCVCVCVYMPVKFSNILCICI